MSPIPRLRSPDSTLALLSQGYAFVSRQCDALETDRFATRLMFRPVVCARGENAMRMFYGSDNFTRKGAMPATTLRLLQDKGSVQSLDGDTHRSRKALFTSLLMEDARVRAFEAAFREAWREAEQQWVRQGSVVLFDAMPIVLVRAVRRWSGLPEEAGSDEVLAEELASMIGAAGHVSPTVLHALALRRWHERRIRAVIRGIRDGRHALPPDAPLAVIAAHRDADGALLTVRSAAVEAINILRPTVAIGRFIGFAAMALHQHPEWRERFAAGDLEGLRPFAEEVRRHYPFFPVVGGRVCCAFEWRGHAFEPGDWVIVNLYGTDHDPRSHPEPEAFRPGRGLDWRDQGFAFVPQGGGDSHRSHRCPGEAVTVALLAEAVRLLCTGLRWEVPPQDLTIDLATMPARPASGVRLSGLQLA